MSGDLFNVGASTPGGQPLDLNRSAAQIPKPLSAGGQGLINNDNYDEYINNTLAEEFSKLSLNNPPLAPISTISNLKNPPSAHTTHILNDTKRQRAGLDILTNDDSCKIANADIAVLTPYTRQLQKLRAKMRNEFEIVLSERDQEILAKDGFIDEEVVGES
ncbi:hypothetical protein BGZ57DRAFT_981182 [Hyaloscypha finlandica]|nr:hypothetical protein BGZ57DRAFT_981182 [Hyaloscypha finlandica]